MPSNAETLISRPNPYVGPRPYRRGETLYGRERESAELADLLIAERIIMLYSPSGAGKSSLMNASLIPALEENGFEVLPVMRVNMEPPEQISMGDSFNRYTYSLLVSMEAVILSEQRFSSEELVSMSLKEYLAKYRERASQLSEDYDEKRSIVLIIDQGEEVITISPTDRDGKQDFFNQLGETLRDRNIWCLYAVREDYLPRLDSYIRPIPTGFSSRYRLRLLQHDAAQDAIQKPAQRQGVDFKEDAARRLLDDLRMMQVQLPDGSSTWEPGLYVEPVQLQVVCRRLWTELPREENEITLENLNEIGDVNTALADYYALQIASVAGKTGVSERAIREWFDRKLISKQGIRLQVLQSLNESEGLQNRVIHELERSYLVRAEKRGATWYELAHDRLIDPIRKNNTLWFGKNLNLFQRAADVWAEQGRSDGLLLYGKDYHDAEKWTKENPGSVNEIERQFLSACKKHFEQSEREKRNNRVVRLLLVISVLALIGAGIMYFRAVSAENLSRSRQLAAASLGALETDPGLSILLALEAMRNTSPPIFEAVDAMHRALPASRLQHTFVGHTERVYFVAYSPDGRWIASASRDGTIKIWDAVSYAAMPAYDFKLSEAANYGATAVAFSPDGSLLAASTGLGELSLFDTASWREVRRIQAHQDTIWGLAFSPDGNLIATAGDDQILKAWNLELTSAIVFPVEHRDAIQSLAFSPDGTQIATASMDGSAIIWDIASAKSLHTFQLRANIVTNPARMIGIVYSLNGSRLITSATDGNIYVWDALTGSKAPIMKITGHDDWVYGLLVRPSYDADAVEGEIISAGADRSIRIWGGQYGRSKLKLRGHSDQVYTLALNPQNSGMLASASGDYTVRVWNIGWDGNYERFTQDLVAPNPKQPNETLPGYSEDVDYSPDGKLLAVALAAASDPDALYPNYGLPGSILLLDPQTGKPARPALQGHTASVLSVGFSPDSTRLISASWDKTAIIWDLLQPNPAPLFVLEHQSQVYSANYSYDGRYIVTGQNNGLVTLWDAASGQFLQSFLPGGERRIIQQVRFNIDSSLVVVQFREDNNLLLVDPQNGQVRITLSGHSDIIRDFDFSPDGRTLVSVGDDAAIILWDLSPDLADEDRELPYDFSDHLATIYSVSFSGDGKRILSAGVDGIIKVWQMSGSKEYETWSLAYSLYAYAFEDDDTILDIEIDPSNFEHVVAVVNDWTVRGFTLNNAELMGLAESKIEDRHLTCRELDRYMLEDIYDCIP